MLNRYLKKIVSVLILFVVLSCFFSAYFSNIFRGHVVNAGSALIEPEMILDKKIRLKEGTQNEFILSLDSFFQIDFDDGESEATHTVSSDYILVIDHSDEMNDSNESSTKIESAKKAAKLILDRLNTNENNIDSRVAIVGYGNSDDFDNTGLYIGKTFKGYSTLDSNLYSQAFQEIDENSYNDLVDAIDSIVPNGECYIDKGLEIANNILKYDKKSSIEYRFPHVIILSGSTQIGNGWGNETYGTQYDGIDVANKALEYAYNLKNTYSCLIDVVGLHMNSSTSIPPTVPTWNDGIVDDYSKTNAFLCYLTSNYPKATSVTEPGSYERGYNFYDNYVNFTKDTVYQFSYYFSNELYYREGRYIPIDEETVVRDVIDSNFKLPEGITNEDIKIYAADVDYMTGDFGEKYLLEDENISVNIYKNDFGQDVVDVTGYDYGNNLVYVYSSSYDSGRKLIIEIPVIIADNSKSGEQICTNADETGMYCLNDNLEYKKILSFPQPQVDVPATVTLNHVFEDTNNLDAAIELNSKYSKLSDYIDEDGDNFYLKAVGEDATSTNVIKNNDSSVFKNIMLNTDYIITTTGDSNYEITKVMVKEESGLEYELAYNNGYSLTISENTDITIYTKLNGRTISVNKQWDDMDNESDVRPENVTVEIYQDDTLYDTIELNTGNNWLYEFFVEDLDKTYIFKEINIDDNYYLKDVEEVSSNNFVLTNNKYGSILINKKDSIWGTKLQGAIFKIEQKNEDSTWAEIGQIETNEAGIAQIDKLIHGTYRITEEKAPDGYNLEIDRNVTEIEINSSKLDYELTILNKPKTILPETGDNGLLIIISIIFILLMIRRKYMGPLIVTQRVRNARINKKIRSNKKFKFIINIDGKVIRKHKRKKARISSKNKRI